MGVREVNSLSLPEMWCRKENVSLTSYCFSLLEKDLEQLKRVQAVGSLLPMARPLSRQLADMPLTNYLCPSCSDTTPVLAYIYLYMSWNHFDCAATHPFVLWQEKLPDLGASEGCVLSKQHHGNLPDCFTCLPCCAQRAGAAAAGGEAAGAHRAGLRGAAGGHLRELRQPVGGLAQRPGREWRAHARAACACPAPGCWALQ